MSNNTTHRCVTKRIPLLVVVLGAIILCCCLFISQRSTRTGAATIPGYSGTNINLIASRLLKGSLAEVRTAIHTYCTASRQPNLFKTNDVTGMSYSLWFSTCAPPQRPLSQKTMWPSFTWPLLRRFGWQSPSFVHYGYWRGIFVARRVTDSQTRLEVFKLQSIPENDTEAAIAYCDRIVKVLEAKP